MVNFYLNNSDLITFIEKCACKGVVLITSSEKTTRNFFNYFYMTVEQGEKDPDNEGEYFPGQIVVKAVDSEERKMFIRHTLKGVNVVDGGSFAVTDAQMILDVLKAIPRNREVRFRVDESELVIETNDSGTYKGYKARQAVPSELVEDALEKSLTGVGEWERNHSIDEDGTPRFTIKEGTALYDIIVQFTKSELMEVIKDSVSLTRDQDVKVSLVKEKDIYKINFHSGKKADELNSDIRMEKSVKNPNVFDDMMITNLHPIVGHLFSTATFYMRLSSDESLKFWIKSSEDNIELNYCSSSL